MSDSQAHRVREAFDRLRDDAASVDSLAALGRTERRSSTRWLGIALPAAAAAVVALTFVLLALGNRSGDQVEVVASIDDPAPATDEAGIGEPVPVAVTDETLAGSAWRLVGGSDRDGDVPVLPGWPISLGFENGTLGGAAACNDFGSAYELLPGGGLRIAAIERTDADCGEAPMASEGRFLGALAVVDRGEIVDDRLRLVGPEVELLFIPAEPTPAAAILGRDWRLASVFDGTGATVAAGGPAMLRLDTDGSLAGSTGCRTFSGRFVVDSLDAGWIRFSELSMEGECGPGLADQDGHVVTVLGDRFSAIVDGERLVLSSRGGLGLEYIVAGPDMSEPEPDVMSAGELLESRRMDPITVEGHLVYRGGSWILCDVLDPAISTGCGGRWLVVVNYDQAVNPHTEPPTGIDDAAFGLAEASPDFAADGDLVYSVEPQRVVVQSVRDGRVVLPEWPWPTMEQNAPDEIPPHPFGELGRVALEDGPIDVGALGLADTVLLGLGDHTLVERTPAQLVDREAWRLDAEDFRARVGPFSALDLLADASSANLLVGRHDHCASPPTPIPVPLQDARQFSVQPLGIDSCLEWWTVDVFVDDDRRIIGITLDLWEP